MTSVRRAFDPQMFVTNVGQGRKLVSVGKGKTIYAQGDAADALFVIKKGTVRLSVKSRSIEATLDILSDKEFVGKDSLTDQSSRTASATAITDCSLLRIEKKAMMLALTRHVKLANLFLACALAKNIRYEQDLVDQRCNPSEKRLAHILLRLAQYDGTEASESTVPKISHETLAGMVGTTRSRVCFFLKRFKQSGFIDYKLGGKTLRVNQTLLAFCSQ
jgi:CRP/FNR family transcriptional regulator, cyclic AMP receptor protein